MSEFQQRRATASDSLTASKSSAQGLDALLVSSPANVRYLTGYAGSNGLVLLTSSGADFFTDPRYSSDARTNIDCRVHIATSGPLIAAAAQVIARKKLKRIGFESAWMNVSEHRRLHDALPAGTRLRPAGGMLEGLRAIKSPDEIAKIRASVNLNSEAYARTIAQVKSGMQEREIAAELDYHMRRLGADKPAFDTIVATGPNSALPHAHPSDRRLSPGDLLLIDMGATVEGYTSDMTRVSYLSDGRVPKRIRDLYAAVLEAQLAAIATVRPGIATRKVDQAARQVLKRHKLDKLFVHSTGHGLGLEIHEGPRIAKPVPQNKAAQPATKKPAKAAEEAELKAGMVITIEPGAYVEGFGGVRIEDTVLVTENGCEILTPTPKEFLQLA